jgi:hypothetical protein
MNTINFDSKIKTRINSLILNLNIYQVLENGDCEVKCNIKKGNRNSVQLISSSPLSTFDITWKTNEININGFFDSKKLEIEITLIESSLIESFVLNGDCKLFIEESLMSNVEFKVELMGEVFFEKNIFSAQKLYIKALDKSKVKAKLCGICNLLDVNLVGNSTIEITTEFDILKVNALSVGESDIIIYSSGVSEEVISKTALTSSSEIKFKSIKKAILSCQNFSFTHLESQETESCVINLQDYTSGTVINAECLVYSIKDSSHLDIMDSKITKSEIKGNAVVNIYHR